MNLVRSIAAVVGTLGLALGAGTVFQQIGQDGAGGQGGRPDAADTASLAHGLRAGPVGSGTLADGVDDASPLAVGPVTAPPSFASPPPFASDRIGAGLTLRPVGAGDAGPTAAPPDSPEIAVAPDAAAPTGAEPLVTAGGAEAALDAILHDDPEAAVPEPCALWLVVTPATGAMLDTSIYAPCHGGQDAMLAHAGMRFTFTLGADGQAQLMVPALRADGRVPLAMADGSTTADSTPVPDMADFDRVVLGWAGPAALALHAFAGDAGFGDAGHVHHDAPAAPSAAPHGFLTSLGEGGTDAARALVYTFPAGARAGRAPVALTAEALITDDSCGQPIAARMMLSHGGAPGTTREISATLPGCDGLDGFLPLGTLVEPQADGLVRAD